MIHLRVSEYRYLSAVCDACGKRDDFHQTAMRGMQSQPALSPSSNQVNHTRHARNPRQSCANRFGSYTKHVYFQAQVTTLHNANTDWLLKEFIVAPSQHLGMLQMELILMFKSANN